MLTGASNTQGCVHKLPLCICVLGTNVSITAREALDWQTVDLSRYVLLWLHLGPIARHRVAVLVQNLIRHL